MKLYAGHDLAGLEHPGQSMYQLMETLFPICRSITGSGLRQTLKLLQQEIPLEITEIPSGKQVFDWEVPKEWTIRDAYIKGPDGQKVIDFQQNNLHVLNYSTPVHAKLSLADLKEHLYTLPEYPDWIPYLTSYYKERWGFCLSQNQLDSLPDGEYEIYIDSDLSPGSLTYGELFIPGESDQEILLSTYLCHPSMCNDNLSGPVVQVTLAKYLLSQPKRRYSYRLLFIPETIGAIAWIAENESKLKNIQSGFILTCTGDAGISHYKKTKEGNTYHDALIEKVLVDSEEPYKIVNFYPMGSDERQFSSPAYNIPMGTLMKTPYAMFPEYHTSADNLAFMKPESLENTYFKHLNALFIYEHNCTYESLNPQCEPQLGKRGLYNTLGSQKNDQAIANVTNEAILGVLIYMDGKRSLLDIANLTELDFSTVKYASDLLFNAGLLKRVPSQENSCLAI